MEYIKIIYNLLAPMILLVLIGYYLKRKKIIKKTYESVSSKIVFNLALPATLFTSTLKADLDLLISSEIWFFMLISIFIFFSLFIITYLISIFISTDKKTKGAFIQCSYRSNYIIIGYPLLISMFGDAVLLPMMLITIIIIPLFNILAVITLTINNPNSTGINRKEIALKILTNPLILSILIGLILNLCHFKVPIFLDNTLNYIKGLTTPLALINIGSMFNFKLDLRNKVVLMVSILLKNIIYPIIFTTIAILFGFRDHFLGTIFMAVATPTPPSAYIMSKIMDSDYRLVSSNIVLSTSLSAFTIFIGIVILKTLHFI